jgi:signal transduction histidine kinase/ActR/RegA family two-component response regulator
MAMPLNPEAIWSERFVEIGTIIETDYEFLIDRWSERAKEEQPNAVHSHFEEMRNMLPELLRAIGRALAQSGRNLAIHHCLIALEHGEHRWKTGWRLAEVVRDYQILRLVILDHLDRSLEPAPLTVREAMAVGLALDEAISASVVAYVGHEDHQLRQANERLSEFFSILGHELRNPLTAIVTTLQLLHLQHAVLPEHEEAFAILDRQVRQLTRLLDDMLDVSRITRGKLEICKGPIAAQEIVRRAVETTRSLLAARGHELQVDLPEAPIELFADASRLEQVLTNLLTNSAKYTPPDGKVSIALAREDEHIVFRVRDNGVGITADMLPKVFAMFAQLPEHRGQGLGVGLALAKTLVEMHDGTLEAYSDGKNKGSEFVCRLPIERVGSQRSSRPAVPTALVPPTAPRDRYRILVVDDQVDALRELCLLLKLFGHEVHTAHSGQEAIEQAVAVRPQVILLDLCMPGMDGYETARRLRAESDLTQVLVVAMTGYAEENDRERTRESGFDHHLMKPVSFDTVQRLLATPPADRGPRLKLAV